MKGRVKMNIIWSYYLIAIIYILVITLKLINVTKALAFKKKNKDAIKIFSIKKDFFTTVSMICIIVTALINGMALWGGKDINVSSIIVTLLVVGFTIINSFSNILFSKENDQLFILGYTLVKEEIESLKIKEKAKSTCYDMTFTKEIDSYNYAKIIVFGDKRQDLKAVIEKLVKKA